MLILGNPWIYDRRLHRDTDINATTRNRQSLGLVLRIRCPLAVHRRQDYRLLDVLFRDVWKKRQLQGADLLLPARWRTHPEFPQDELIDMVWSNIHECATESVKVIQFILTMRREFESIRAAGLTDDITKFLENDWKNPEVEAMLAKFLIISGKPKSAGGSCKTLLEIDTAESQIDCAVQPVMRMVSRLTASGDILTGNLK
jgi:hypothetical protein